MIDSKYALYPAAFQNLGTSDLYLFDRNVVPLDEDNRIIRSTDAHDLIWSAKLTPFGEA